MRTMVQRAAGELDLEMISSRRTYALLDWLQQQDGATMMQALGSMVSQIPQGELPGMIEQHIGHQPEEVKIQVRSQIERVYSFFLSCSQQGVVYPQNG